MKQRTILICGSCLLLLISGVFLWLLLAERQRTNSLVAHIDQRINQCADFVAYRAYKDATSDINAGILHFSSLDDWDRSFQVGALKVVAERVPSRDEALQATGATLLRATSAPQPTPSPTNVIDWRSVYNWHKSRAAFRQLQRGVNPSAASELLDNLERVRILTHAERLGVEDPNTLDPY